MESLSSVNTDSNTGSVLFGSTKDLMNVLVSVPGQVDSLSW